MTNWLITGAGSGFGRAIAAEALERGDGVAGVFRKDGEAEAFEQLRQSRTLGIVMDVAEEAAVRAGVARAEAELGPIDVLVNGAGYGLEGIVEECAMTAIRRQFEVNVFGAVSMMKAVMPFMRARRSGTIVNITSMAAFSAAPGLGAYAASKAALESFSEAAAKEVMSFGVRVLAVAPGAFRTDWAGRSMVRAPRSIPDYDALMDPLREKRLRFSGSQPGDPAKAARSIIDRALNSDPPAQLLLGRDALDVVTSRVAALSACLEASRELARSTDFDPAG